VVTTGRAAVFLDRDGVVVVPEFRDGRSYAPTALEALRIYPQAAESLQKLRDAGYLLVLVTNQPDVGKGVIPVAVMAAMTARLEAELPLDRVEICTHTREDNCDCRKPKPGMLLQAAEALGIRLDRSFMIGDRESDILAGAAAGCRTIFVDLDYAAEPRPQAADWTVRSIAEAAACILAASESGENKHVQAR
jgi:D-glycero-D-manno-heptose 1,7-bisphosphate phosphatase